MIPPLRIPRYFPSFSTLKLQYSQPILHACYSEYQPTNMSVNCHFETVMKTKNCHVMIFIKSINCHVEIVMKSINCHVEIVMKSINIHVTIVNKSIKCLHCYQIYKILTFLRFPNQVLWLVCNGYLFEELWMCMTAKEVDDLFCCDTSSECFSHALTHQRAYHHVGKPERKTQCNYFF